LRSTIGTYTFDLKVVLAGVLLVLLQYPASGQDFRQERQEFQQWVNLSLRYSPKKSPLVLNAEYVMRSHGFFDEFKGSYYYLQTRWRFNKHWHMDLHLRAVNTHVQDRYRWETGIRYRRQVWKGMMQVRSAFFNERRQFGLTDDIMRPPQHYWRTRLLYRHQVSKDWRVYASGEVFYRLDRRPQPELRRIAYIGGISHRVGRNSTLFLEYIHQPEYSRYAKRLHTLNIGFDQDISPPRKKKKKKGVKPVEYEEGPADRR
jgi:hypothetical protein